MKYSKSKQKHHLEKIATILLRDHQMSSREICRTLDKEGFHLSRGYVSKLMQDAELLATQREIDKENILVEIRKWLEELSILVNDFYFEFKDRVLDYPPDREDRETADLPEEPR